MIRMSVKGMVLAASVIVGIAASEGYVRDAMIPVPGDVPTIGFGSTKDVRMGDTTTPVRALVRLLDEVDTIYAQGVRTCVLVPLFPWEFAAFVSLAYNIGVKRTSAMPPIVFIHAYPHISLSLTHDD